MSSKIINPWSWQDQLGFVQAVETTGAQSILYCAGQAAINENGEPLHEGNMRAQLALALDNLETVLKKAGYTLSDVVRLTCYVTDVDRFVEAWGEEVAQRLAPANCRATSSLLGVSRLAFPQLLVEIEATAAR